MCRIVLTATALGLIAACSDGAGPLVHAYTVEVVAEGEYILVELNEAGQVLLDGTVLWTPGEGLRRIPLPSAVDLGPDGSVLGSSPNGLVALWQNGTVTEIGEGTPIGIANETGQAYFQQVGVVRTWDGTSADSVGFYPQTAHLVGEDGALYGHTWDPETGAHDCWRSVGGETQAYFTSRHECRAVAGNAQGWVLFKSIIGYQNVALWNGSELVGFPELEVEATDLNDLGAVVGTRFGVWADGHVKWLDSFMAERGWTESTDARINNTGQLLFNVGDAVVLLTPRP